MEHFLIWMGVLALAAVIFIPYLLKFRASRRVFAERREEARAMGIDRPRAQFPMVNRSQCIGCGACVEACPEGDVLGVVWGVAEVINGQRCVGHGLRSPVRWVLSKSVWGISRPVRISRC